MRKVSRPSRTRTIEPDGLVPQSLSWALTRSIRGCRRWRTAIVAIVVGSTVLTAHADTLITEGMQPWETCAECHSLDGISATARFPKLAGQRPAYIAKQVRDFSEGRRRNDGGQMASVAADIGDEDLAKAAEYFGGLPDPPPDSSLATESEEWLRGATLFRKGEPATGIAQCGACHDGAAPERADAPYLKAQHAAYLAKQLRDWRSGDRRNGLDQVMPAIAAKLSDHDIAALAAFLASQPRIGSNRSPAQ